MKWNNKYMILSFVSFALCGIAISTLLLDGIKPKEKISVLLPACSLLISGYVFYQKGKS